MVNPPTCCKATEGDFCACATQAKCSCGKEDALHCNCYKSPTENSISGPRCSCRTRPAGQCTCDRAKVENKDITGKTCSCGKRPQNSCTCEKANGGVSGPETDFTTIV